MKLVVLSTIFIVVKTCLRLAYTLILMNAFFCSKFKRGRVGLLVFKQNLRTVLNPSHGSVWSFRLFSVIVIHDYFIFLLSFITFLNRCWWVFIIFCPISGR